MEFSRNPIKNRTAKLVMGGFAVLIFLSAFTLLGFDLLGFEIPLKVIGIILLVAVSINFFEIGLKRLTPLSDLKRLNPIQVASLIIGSLILITAIFFLFGNIPTFIATFAPGILFFEGLVVTLEIFF